MVGTAVGTAVGTVAGTAVVVLAYTEAYMGPNTGVVAEQRVGGFFLFYFVGLTHSQYSLALRDRMLFCLAY